MAKGLISNQHLSSILSCAAPGEEASLSFKNKNSDGEPLMVDVSRNGKKRSFYVLPASRTWLDTAKTICSLGFFPTIARADVVSCDAPQVRANFPIDVVCSGTGTVVHGNGSAKAVRFMANNLG